MLKGQEVDFVNEQKKLSRGFTAYGANFDINIRRPALGGSCDVKIERAAVKLAVQRGIWVPTLGVNNLHNI
jgi:hypothetical protein